MAAMALATATNFAAAAIALHRTIGCGLVALHHPMLLPPVCGLNLRCRQWACIILVLITKAVKMQPLQRHRHFEFKHQWLGPTLGALPVALLDKLPRCLFRIEVGVHRALVCAMILALACHHFNVPNFLVDTKCLT